MSVRAFRFRAQPALDLRRREDDEAQGILARAEAALRDARRALADAETRVREARTQCAALMAQPGQGAEQLWYRSWIVRLDREQAAYAHAASVAEGVVARAAAMRAHTQQRVKALERLKDKGIRRWEREAAAEEQKHLDALATVRFVTGRQAHG